jgi:hypothetical protein
MAGAYKLGRNAKAYYGATLATTSSNTDLGTAVAAATEIAVVKDAEVGSEKEQADTSNRSSGVETSIPVSTKQSITFKMPWFPGDTAFDALLAAHNADTPIFFAALDGPQATSGSQGPAGNFTVSKFVRGEGFKDVQMADVEVKPYSCNGWFKKT